MRVTSNHTHPLVLAIKECSDIIPGIKRIAITDLMRIFSTQEYKDAMSKGELGKYNIPKMVNTYSYHVDIEMWCLIFDILRRNHYLLDN